MDVIASCGYGINVNSVRQPNHPIVENAKRILGVDASFKFVFTLIFNKIAELFRMEVFDADSINYFDSLTHQIIEERLNQNTKTDAKDLVGLMMQNLENVSKAPNKHQLKGITKDEISGQGIIFFVAGYDTTNTTFCHLVYYLSKHPEWQDNLFEELSQIDNGLSYENLTNQPVLNAVIKETLRLNPPLSEFNREANEDFYFEQLKIMIPKNTMILIQPYAIHRNADYFDDPESFRPERWLSDNPDPHGAYIPFGIGNRLCVGMRFALNELRFGLAHFVLNYRVKANPDLKVSLCGYKVFRLLYFPFGSLNITEDPFWCHPRR